MRLFSFSSTFLISLLICFTKEPLPSIVARRTTTREFKVDSATMYVCNSSVNGRRCDAIDSIEIHRETNSWLRVVRKRGRKREREKERRRDKGQFSKYTRPSFQWRAADSLPLPCSESPFTFHVPRILNTP